MKKDSQDGKTSCFYQISENVDIHSFKEITSLNIRLQIQDY